MCVAGFFPFPSQTPLSGREKADSTNNRRDSNKMDAQRQSMDKKYCTKDKARAAQESWNKEIVLRQIKKSCI